MLMTLVTRANARRFDEKFPLQAPGNEHKSLFSKRLCLWTRRKRESVGMPKTVVQDYFVRTRHFDFCLGDGGVLKSPPAPKNTLVEIPGAGMLGSRVGEPEPGLRDFEGDMDSAACEFHLLRFQRGKACKWFSIEAD